MEEKLTFRVSVKGAASVYGLGRFPTTLYFAQWKKLLEVANELDEFLETHKAELKMLPQKET